MRVALFFTLFMVCAMAHPMSPPGGDGGLAGASAGGGGGNAKQDAAGPGTEAAAKEGEGSEESSIPFEDPRMMTFPPRKHDLGKPA